MQDRTRSQDIAGRAARPGPVLKTAWVAFESLGEASQARRLASDTRAGVWARGKARREQRRFLKRKWRLFTGALLTWFALVAAAAAFMPGDLLRGMVIGAGAVAGPTGIWVLVIQLTGTASTMMGDTAEQWTAQELRPLSKDGWRLINHFGLTGDDLDHLLVGPVASSSWRRSGPARTGSRPAAVSGNAAQLHKPPPTLAGSTCGRPSRNLSSTHNRWSFCGGPTSAS